ncbi:hypothetical protein BJX63DRAFT_394463 [Aspergillus granulosus]|uniref:Uncharacterized protein n=1 Tax=Aspergillus granulosus TaxID=176169 RepID=A0ABR4GV49_9EURO
MHNPPAKPAPNPPRTRSGAGSGWAVKNPHPLRVLGMSPQRVAGPRAGSWVGDSPSPQEPEPA